MGSEMLHQVVRGLAFASGAFMFLGGLILLACGPEAAISGVWAIAFGVGVMIATMIQRSGYRSEAAERGHLPPGPGSGETGAMDPRFVPTNEVFIDPVSHLAMRVYVDQRTGERRYRAEGLT